MFLLQIQNQAILDVFVDKNQDYSFNKELLIRPVVEIFPLSS
jgi:hypothetical protein